MAARLLAAGLGVEPRCHGSEPCILPLDDPAMKNYVKLYQLLIAETNEEWTF